MSPHASSAWLAGLCAAVANYGLPAMAALVAVEGQVVAEQAVGVRSVRRDARVTIPDRWHLGSNTKAMTAAMIARLAERGELSFDIPNGEYLPDLRDAMHPAYRDVTLAQLLTQHGYRRLHAPPTDDASYAMGWGVRAGLQGMPLVLAHSGSNGNWFADVRASPADDTVVLVVTNIGGDAAEQAVREVRTALVRALG